MTTTTCQKRLKRIVVSGFWFCFAICFTPGCDRSERLFNNETPIQPEVVEQAKKEEQARARGSYLFSEHEITEDEYRRLVVQKLDVVRTKGLLANMYQIDGRKYQHGKADSFDLNGMIDAIGLGEDTSSRQSESACENANAATQGAVTDRGENPLEMTVDPVCETRPIENASPGIREIGNKASESDWYLYANTEIGQLYVIDRTIPAARIVDQDKISGDGTRSLSSEEKDRDKRIEQSVYGIMKFWGADPEEIDLRITGLMSNGRDDEDEKSVTREHERLAFVHRTIEGIRVLNNQAVLNYHLDGRLRKISGAWNQVDYGRSQFNTDKSPQEIIDAVVDTIVEKELNPYFIDELFAAPVFTVEKDEYDNYRIDLKVTTYVGIQTPAGATDGVKILLDV